MPESASVPISNLAQGVSLKPLAVGNKVKLESAHPSNSPTPKSAGFYEGSQFEADRLTLALSEPLKIPYAQWLDRCVRLTSQIRASATSVTSALYGYIQDDRPSQIQHTNGGIRLGHAALVCLVVVGPTPRQKVVEGPTSVSTHTG